FRCTSSRSAACRSCKRASSRRCRPCAVIGGVLGGIISDAILRKTQSLTLARKIPIVGGMLLSMSIIACNYVDGQALVVGFMALAFFGQGHRRARLGCRLRHLAEGSRRRVRRPV